jgi:hypothetical protein
MRNAFFLFILTSLISFSLVVPSPARAAVGEAPEDFLGSPDSTSENTTPDPESEPGSDRTRTDLIDIAKPRQLSHRQMRQLSEYFYPYHRSMTPRVGFSYDSYTYPNDQKFPALFGFEYLYRTQALHSYEAGADLLTDNSGQAHFSRRWFYSRSSFRPYSKAGGGLRIVPNDGLATFLRFENFQVRGAIGAEQLIIDPMSLRFEIEAAISTKRVNLFATLGYSFAF